MVAVASPDEIRPVPWDCKACVLSPGDRIKGFRGSRKATDYEMADKYHLEYKGIATDENGHDCIMFDVYPNPFKQYFGQLIGEQAYEAFYIVNGERLFICGHRGGKDFVVKQWIRKV
jgi:hypothetical protein